MPEETAKTIVEINTTKGPITLELFDDQAPVTCGSFLLLAEAGYYNGVVVHRVVPGFCVQTGDPTGTGRGGPGFTIPDELRPDLKHGLGVLSMAKTAAPDSGGSQFFICLGGPQAVGHLDMKHTVFGKVIAGMDVVTSIVQGDVMDQVTITSEAPTTAAAREQALAARKPN